MNARSAFFPLVLRGAMAGDKGGVGLHMACNLCKWKGEGILNKFWEEKGLKKGLDCWLGNWSLGLGQPWKLIPSLRHHY